MQISGKALWPSVVVSLLASILFSLRSSGADADATEFPPELVHWVPYKGNPVFAGTGRDTWDRHIRERGYVLKEGDHWRLWYTGYDAGQHNLGLATSDDGFSWKRFDDAPIFSSRWTEDMMVVKRDNAYFMAAEGLHDIAHSLTSDDGIHWTDQGDLNILKANGEPLSEGPYGTPTIWIESNVWYLLYERNDDAIYLAKSTDQKVWTNVQDEPVIKRGPEPYDQFGLALNQVIRYRGHFYGIYHGTDRKDWGRWSTNIAVSDDLIHWRKYPHNPIVEDNRSSGIIIQDGDNLRLYTMHPDVCVFFPAGSKEAAKQ
ncbi:glycosylase [bacterium]|nr:glycosylase [bacterium]